ncbi:MAG: hypothetical protein J3K34DRAFT_117205 [Monoraphidium minutum]|nr:MAG: hypothetical protein J3K34DRAFT_117205 [Monoraphidium minutum]
MSPLGPGVSIPKWQPPEPAIHSPFSTHIYPEYTLLQTPTVLHTPLPSRMSPLNPEALCFVPGSSYKSDTSFPDADSEVRLGHERGWLFAGGSLACPVHPGPCCARSDVLARTWRAPWRRDRAVWRGSAAGVRLQPRRGAGAARTHAAKRARPEGRTHPHTCPIWPLARTGRPLTNGGAPPPPLESIGLAAARARAPSHTLADRPAARSPFPAHTLARPQDQITQEDLDELEAAEDWVALQAGIAEAELEFLIDMALDNAAPARVAEAERAAARPEVAK